MRDHVTRYSIFYVIATYCAVVGVDMLWRNWIAQIPNGYQLTMIVVAGSWLTAIWAINTLTK